MIRTILAALLFVPPAFAGSYGPGPQRHVSGAQLVKADPDMAEKAGGSPIFRPSGFVWAAQSEAASMTQFLALSSGADDLGLIREGTYFNWRNADNYSAAATADEFMTDLEAYFGDANTQTLIARGTFAVYLGPWNGGYAASTDEDVYLKDVPDDVSDGGAFETLMANAARLLCTGDTFTPYTTEVTGFGFTIAPDLESSGIIVHGANEVSDSDGWTSSEYLTTLQRTYEGVRAYCTDIIFAAPTVSRHDSVLTSGGDSAIHDVIEFFNDNTLELGAVDIHLFPGDPRGWAETSAATVADAVADFSAPTPAIISTEHQLANGSGGEQWALSDGAGGTVNGQYDYPHAAYECMQMVAAYRAGFTGIAHAAVVKEFTGTPTDADPFDTAEAGGTFRWWGYATRLTTSGYGPIPDSAGALQHLKPLWDGWDIVESSPAEVANARGVAKVTFTDGSDVITMACRWDPGRPSVQLSLAIDACPADEALSESRLYAFTAATNNPYQTWVDAVGTNAQRIAEAQAAGENPTYVTGSSLRVTTTAPAFWAGVVRWVCS